MNLPASRFVCITPNSPTHLKRTSHYNRASLNIFALKKVAELFATVFQNYVTRKSRVKGWLHCWCSQKCNKWDFLLFALNRVCGWPFISMNWQTATYKTPENNYYGTYTALSITIKNKLMTVVTCIRNNRKGEKEEERVFISKNL